MNKLLIFLAVILVSFVFMSTAYAEIKEYNLRVRTEPNVLFIGGSGVYKEGAVVTIDKAPDVWQNYKFVGWKVDGGWVTVNPPNIRMDTNHEITAIYTKNDIATLKIDAIPRVAKISVDDKIYLPSELPLALTFPFGTTVTIAIDEVMDDDPNTRYVFDVWKDMEKSNQRMITLDDDVSLTALLKTQFQLKAISEFGTTYGAGWWDKGTTVQFGIDNATVVDKNNEQIRYVFEGWNDGYYKNSETNSIDIEAPTTVLANWKQQYKLDLVSSVTGVSLYGGGWYNEGKTVAIIAEEEYESPEADAKYVFDRWESVGPNTVIIPNPQSPLTTVTPDAPYFIEAKYKKSYLVNAYTPFGTASGSGFYAEGSNAEIKIITPEVITEPNKVKKVFAGWDAGDNKIVNTVPGNPDLGGPTTNQNLVITVGKPTTIIAKWRDQYYLDVQSPESKVTGSGWYDIGKVVPISVSVPSVPPGAWSTYSFAGWSGDYDGKSVRGMVLVNKPKSVVAEWKDDYTPGVVNAMILSGVGTAGIMIINKTKKKQTPLTAMAKPYSKKFARDMLSAGMVIINKTRKRLTSRNYDKPDSKYHKNYDDQNNRYMKSESLDSYASAVFDDKNDPNLKRSSRHSPAGIA